MADEAGGHIVAESEFRVPLDGDVVVVVDPAKVREFQVAGQGGRLGRDAFHHAAIPAQGIDVEVDQVFKASLVEVGSLPAAGDGHTNTVGQPLPERAGRGLDTAGPAVFGMAGATAVE